MFGKNAVAGPRKLEDGYLIKEVFHTIQGEGPLAGHPAIFVRFAQCNLRCFFCDTDFEDGERFTLEQLVVAIIQLSLANPKTRLIVFTGGEPMLQPIFTLADQFPADRFTVQIETAGTVWPDDVLSPGNFRNMQIICSPKTPKIHDAIPQWVSAWKYIVDAEDPGWIDGLPMTSTQLPGRSVRIYRPKPGHPAPIYVQPRDDYDPDKNQANMRHAAQLAMEQGYRLSVQVHKLVGLP